MKTTSYSKVFVERLAESQADLYSFVASLLPFNVDDVDDVVQETNLSMIRDAEHYDEARPFRPWMFTIALRRVEDFRRKSMRGKVVFSDEVLERAAAPMLDDSASDGGHETLLRHLAECKERLKEDQRRMLDLRYSQHLSAENIAKETNSTPGQVYNALAYIRRKLAGCVRRLCRIKEDVPEDASEMESAIARVLDAAPSREARARLETLVEGTEDLTEYMDQMLIHNLLSHGWIKQKAEPAAARRRSAAPWPAVLAAGLALLLAGAFAAARLWPQGGSKNAAESLPPQTALQKTQAGERRTVESAELAAQSAGLSAQEKMQTVRNEREEEAKPLSSAGAEESVKGETMHTQTTLAAVAAAAGIAAVAPSPKTVMASTADPAVLASLYANAPRYWQTAYTNEIPIRWEWGPAAATRAAFSYEGMNASGSKTFLRSGGDASCFLPASADEDLYTLRLNFTDDAGNTLAALTGRVAAVRGVSRSVDVVLPRLDVSSTATNAAQIPAWPRVSRPGAKEGNAVIAYDATWVTNAAATAVSLAIARQNGTKSATTSLESPNGWTAWQPAKGKWGSGWFAFTLSVDGETLGVPVYRPSTGFVMYLK